MMLLLFAYVLFSIVVFIIIWYNICRNSKDIIYIYRPREYISLQADNVLVEELLKFNTNQEHRIKAHCSNIYHIHIVGEMYRANDLAKDIINRVLPYATSYMMRTETAPLNKTAQIIELKPYLYTNATDTYIDRVKRIFNSRWPSTTIIITRDPEQTCPYADFNIENNRIDHDIIQYLQFVYDCSIGDAKDKYDKICQEIKPDAATLKKISRHIKLA